MCGFGIRARAGRPPRAKITRLHGGGFKTQFSQKPQIIKTHGENHVSRNRQKEMAYDAESVLAHAAHAAQSTLLAWSERTFQNPGLLVAVLTVALLVAWPILHACCSCCCCCCARRRRDGYERYRDGEEDETSVHLRLKHVEAEAEVQRLEAELLDLVRRWEQDHAQHGPVSAAGDPAAAGRRVVSRIEAVNKEHKDALDARRAAAQDAAAASLARAEAALAFARLEAGKRAAAYRAHMASLLALPALTEEALGTRHSPIKPKLPTFKRDAPKTATSLGRVLVPPTLPTPFTSARSAVPRSPTAASAGASRGARPAIGAAPAPGSYRWGSNVFVLPVLKAQPATERSSTGAPQTAWQLGRMLAMHANAFTQRSQRSARCAPSEQQSQRRQQSTATDVAMAASGASAATSSALNASGRTASPLDGSSDAPPITVERLSGGRRSPFGPKPSKVPLSQGAARC